MRPSGGRRFNGADKAVLALFVLFVAWVIAKTPLINLRAANREGRGSECLSNVRNIVGLLLWRGLSGTPHHGVDLVLSLVETGDLVGADQLRTLFCPVDRLESLEKAGGVEAYRNLDLRRPGKRGHLTSYAGRDLLAAGCGLGSGPVVLLCDDSWDHHRGKGLVVGLSDGSTRWRDRLDDYELLRVEPLIVGAGSKVEELRCLRGE